jgi:hypothetical protein
MNLILDLCAGSGAWSAPYVAAGYEVVRLDLPRDVRLERWRDWTVHGILAAPPCTVFAGSGARWPRTQAEIREALGVVDACLRAVTLYTPVWWALENPIGTLRRWLGPPRMYFDPCEYGEPYTKRTCLWGTFKAPFKVDRIAPTDGSKLHRLPPSSHRAALRSITPAGFAQAFFEANP